MAGQVFINRFVSVAKHFIPLFMDYKTWKGQLTQLLDNETTMIMRN